MSAKEACKLVGDVMNQLDIDVVDYDVYPVDFEYIVLIQHWKK